MPQKNERLRILTNQISRLHHQIERLERLSRRYAWGRLLIVLLGALAALAIFDRWGGWWAAASLLLTLLAFALLAAYHQRVDETQQRLTLLQTITRQQVARGQLAWSQLPAARIQAGRPEHPFEIDLDLVGDYGLHRLLDTTAARQGSERLHTWLTTPLTELTQIQARQALVLELTPLTAFRDKLAVNGARLRTQAVDWDAERLLGWLQKQQPVGGLRLWLGLLSGLALVNALLFVGYGLGWIGPWWQWSLTLYAAIYLLNGRLVGEVFGEASTLRDQVQQLAGLFRHLESYSYRQQPQLRTLCQPFLDAEQQPSIHLKRLARVVAATGVQGNPLIALAINTVVPWGLYFAYRLTQEKAAIAQQMPTWVAVWSEVEALAALATFAWLNPHYTFPQLQSTAVPLVLAVDGLGHPLIADAVKVRNSFQVDQTGSVAILTGSNMAGKSSFLRALGLNLVLAHAGSVVDAERLATHLLRIYTCIRVSDSLADGVSYFYAEVQRLKRLLDELARVDDRPLFFAIDEIFRGTNNRERLLGSRAYIRALTQHTGIGLVATHDLELVKLAEEVPAITNYHFRDEILNGQMHFDYTLHPGPCPTTNALKIMRAAGLPV